MIKNNEKSTIVISHNTAKYLLMHYRQLLLDLNKEYDRVVCVTPKDGHEHEFSTLGLEYRAITMEQHGMNPFMELKLVRQFLAIYRELKPSKVINFSIKPCLYGGYAAKQAKVPIAGYMVTGLGYIFLTQTAKVALLRKFVVRLYRNNLRPSDQVFFQNRDDEKLFADLGITDLADTHVVPGTGIDLNEFKPVEKALEGVDKVRFLFIGRMLKDKGLYELVKACYALRKQGARFQCDFLGPLDNNPSAISREELDAWQKKRLIRYLGETHDVKSRIAKSHVFVLPSYREGLPRAGLEAMAMGLPVITTDVPGCREIVEHKKNGFLIESHHSTPLARAMKKFIDNKAMIQEMGANSRKICEDRFSVELVSDIVRSAMAE